MPLLFFIPFNTYLGNVVVFLVINGLGVFLRLYAIFKVKFEKMPSYRKWIGNVNVVLWIIHHLIFTAFWILDKSNPNEIELKIINMLGLFSVITVLLIFLVECLKLLCVVIKAIKDSIMFINKICKDFHQGKLKEKYLK